MMLKESFLTRQKKQIEQDLSEDNERFNVLVEAMSEVVKEHKKSLLALACIYTANCYYSFQFYLLLLEKC